MNQYCLKGKFLFDSGKAGDASKAFVHVLDKIVRDDSYSFLGLADIALKNAIDCKS